MSNSPVELSIIIPTCHRSHEALAKCIDSLARQTLSQEKFEVILCDDGSPAQARASTEPLLKEKIRNYSYLWQPRSGQGAARNKGIAVARGRILLILNDDAIAIPSLLDDHLRAHAQYAQEGVVVLGKFTVSPELPYSMFAGLHSDLSYGPFAGKTELDWRAFYTCNISVRKSFLEKFGTFDEKLRYYEDVELGYRLTRHGLKIIYQPEILAYHYHYLGEEHFLGYAPFHAQALVAWYKKSPELAGEFVPYGFYLAEAWPRRVKYFFYDLLINPLTTPMFIRWARSLAKWDEKRSLSIYKHVFAAISRRTIRHELRKKD